MPDPIYLDYNATTPLLPEVVDAMLPYLRTHFGNPSSTHPYGVRAHAAVEQARAQVAAAIGAQADEILFTSGGTEANNLAIFGTVAHRERACVITSAIEHPATARPCDALAARGAEIVRLSVAAHGAIDPQRVRDAFARDVDLLTVMHSNNETGVVQPVAALAALARSRGARVHTDAAQSLGKVRVDVSALDVDLLSIAGHKLYAPKGVGALYVRRGVELRPYVLGAGHERGLRPGTENVASIVGLGLACALAARDLDARAARLEALRERLWQRLRIAVTDLVRNGAGAPCLPNTLNVLFPGVSGNALLDGAPEVAASTGSACHAGEESPSSVLLAMGIPARDALGAVRLTLGIGTREDDVDRAAAALAASYARLRAGAHRDSA